MKTIKTFSILVIGLGVLTSSSLAMRNAFTEEEFARFKTVVAESKTAEEFREKMVEIRKAKKVKREAIREKINKNVEKTDNGVVLRITSDDASVITLIKERHAKKEARRSEREERRKEEGRKPRNKKADKTFKVLENGIQVTITSADKDMVQKLHTKDFTKKRRSHRRGEK